VCNTLKAVMVLIESLDQISNNSQASAGAAVNDCLFVC